MLGTMTTALDKTRPAAREIPKPDHTIRADRRVRSRIFVGDCRDVLAKIPECAQGEVDLIFADPPFNWNRSYDKWNDAMPREDYCDLADLTRDPGDCRSFTMQWLDQCIAALSPTGSLWVNIPDDSAAEIVCFLKARKLFMVNWCVWHYRFGQNTTGRFINSKVHALYFCKSPIERTFNADAILEVSDRRSIYADKRTESKRDGVAPGMRLPMDVWYGQYWGRIQGNNKERRPLHDNQLPEVYLERVILACSNEGDLVLDPFTGSGTTGVVAHAWDRRFVGIEYSPDMAASAASRIKSGMVRKGASQGQSSAIAPQRSTNRRPKTTRR